MATFFIEEEAKCIYEENPTVKIATNRLLTILLLSFVSMLAHAGAVLVDADWLAKKLEDPAIVIVDMAGGQGQFKDRYIPGAVRLPYSALVQRDKRGVSLRVSDERLYQVLGALGIDAGKQVVIYDDMGGLHASRLYWELERMGHAKASVLDGGIVEWLRRGLPVTSALAQPKHVTYKANGAGRANEADLSTVKAAMADGGTLLLDVRSRNEYLGDPGQPRSGHVPGARWWPWEQVLQVDKGLTAKDEKLLLASLEQVGVTKDKPVITYCQSGHRAARAYLTLRRLGFENVKLYDGSMSEWSRVGDVPVKRGMAP